MKHLTSNPARKMTMAAIALVLIAPFGIVPWQVVAQNADNQAEIAKLKEENARLRAELEQARAESEAARQQANGWDKAAAKLKAVQEKMEQQLKKIPLDQAMEEVRAKLEAAQQELQKSLEKFTENHPFVQEQRDKMEALRKKLENLNFEGRALRNQRKANPKISAQERELLLQEIKLAEQQVEETTKRVEFGTALPDELLRVERELFSMKKELAALESNTSQQRELIEQEIKQLERQLQFVGEKIKSGVLEPNRDLPLRREILRLKRELVALEGPEAQPAEP